MVSERNRIIRLKEYFESLGIEVNIGKNKARGNKGFFRGTKNGGYRIDIANNLDEESVLSVLAHEFAHYIHFCQDNKLENLDFAFGNVTDCMQEELINLTVKKIPKKEAATLFDMKENVNKEIKALADKIKQTEADFKISKPNKKLERFLSSPLKYFLKYDRVKIFNKIYSVTDLSDYDLSDEQKYYLELKSKQRALKRINSRISKLNKYYNAPTELFARFFETYALSKNEAYELAPELSKSFESNLSCLKDAKKFLELCEFL